MLGLVTARKSPPVGGVVLLPLDVGLHIGRRHQSHRMPQRLQLAGPMVRRRTSLNPDQAWRQLLEKCQDVSTHGA